MRSDPKRATISCWKRGTTLRQAPPPVDAAPASRGLERARFEFDPVARRELPGERQIGRNDGARDRISAGRRVIVHQQYWLACRRHLNGAGGDRRRRSARRGAASIVGAFEPIAHSIGVRRDAKPLRREMCTLVADLPGSCAAELATPARRQGVGSVIALSLNPRPSPLFPTRMVSPALSARPS